MDHKIHISCDDKQLLDYGFKKQKSSYILRLPLYTYKNCAVIEARFLISLEKNYFHYDIIDVNSDSIYAAFYDNEYSNPEKNKVLKIVKKNLSKNIQLMKKANIVL